MASHTCAILSTVILLTGTGTVAAADQNPELKQFQGRWEVIELAEDGKVIPKEAISEWLPSGGQFEIAENAIVFTSPDDGKKQVKVFSLDATQYPKGIDLSTREKKDGLGIYRFDDDRLIICFADADESKRPTEFSAKEGSEQTLMTLQRVAAAKQAAQQPAPKGKQPSGTTAKVVTDAQARDLLKGTWKYTDSIGALFATFNLDGTFSTVREVKEIRLFQKVFVRTKISAGKWNIENGTLTFHITSSIHKNKISKEFEFVVRSISDRDFIFVDSLGRVAQAVKAP